MEERIISYDTVKQIPTILKDNLTGDFLFVRHNSTKKLLFFKKSPNPPTTWLED